MDGIFSFLLFAGLFYFMMRMGCGSHAIHGRGHSQKHSQDQSHDPQPHDTRSMTNAVDPVCGKPLRDDEGYGKMHEGQLYRFCSQKCLQTFEGHPEEFILNSTKALKLNGGHEK